MHPIFAIRTIYASKQLIFSFSLYDFYMNFYFNVKFFLFVDTNKVYRVRKKVAFWDGNGVNTRSNGVVWIKSRQVCKTKSIANRQSIARVRFHSRYTQCPCATFKNWFHPWNWFALVTRRRSVSSIPLGQIYDLATSTIVTVGAPRARTSCTCFRVVNFIASRVPNQISVLCRTRRGTASRARRDRTGGRLC